MLNTQHVIKLFTKTEFNNPAAGYDTINKLKGIKKNKRCILKSILKSNVYKHADRTTLSKAFLKLLSIEKETFLDASFVIHINSEVEEKVNDKIRDVEVEKLIDLNKVYYNLPIDVICYSIALIDRFIAKVRVKPKYISCLIAACLQIAAEKKGHSKKFLESKYMANFLFYGATANDLDRLREIVQNKLCNCMPQVTLVDFLTTICPSLVGCDFNESDKKDIAIADSDLDYCYEEDQLWNSQSDDDDEDEPDVSGKDGGVIRLKKKNVIKKSCDLDMQRIIEAALCKFKICMNKSSHVALACLTNYRQKILQEYHGRFYCYNIDNESVRYLTEIVSQEYVLRSQSPNAVNKPTSSSDKETKVLPLTHTRGKLIWIISRRTMSKISTSHPPLLNTIQEEDDCDSQIDEVDEKKQDYECELTSEE